MGRRWRLWGRRSEIPEGASWLDEFNLAALGLLRLRRGLSFEGLSTIALATLSLGCTGGSATSPAPTQASVQPNSAVATHGADTQATSDPTSTLLPFDEQVRQALGHGMAAINLAYQRAELAGIAECITSAGFVADDEVMRGFQDQPESANEITAYLDLMRQPAAEPESEAQRQWKLPEFRELAQRCSQEGSNSFPNPTAKLEAQLDGVSQSFFDRLPTDPRYLQALEQATSCLVDRGHAGDPSAGINDAVMDAGETYSAYASGALERADAEVTLQQLAERVTEGQAIASECFSDLKVTEIAVLSELQQAWLQANPGLIAGFAEEVREQVAALDAFLPKDG